MNLSRMFFAACFGVVAVTSFAPTIAGAFPFGGQITLFHVCYNETLFARLSPPVPGDYVYVLGHTKAYQFGPPRSTGQWLLGLTSIPFDCLWSVNPIFPVPAIAIMMMGSSQAGPLKLSSGSYTADPTQLRSGAGRYGNPNPTYTGAPQYTGGAASLTNVIISEVFPAVDAAHGSDPNNEWIEIFNGTNAPVNISGWTIRTSAGTNTIPSGTEVRQGSFVILTKDAALQNFWTIPTGMRIVSLGTTIGGTGLSASSDVVVLRSTSGDLVDSVSWGTNTDAFSPAVPQPAIGRALYRKSIFTDTNSASDWGDAVPSPGN